MNRIKRLALHAPLIFGLAVTLAFVAMLILTAVVANRWPAESNGWYIASTIGRAISLVILLVLVSGLGWLRPAGLTNPGSWQTWLLALLLLLYLTGASMVAMNGSLELSFMEEALPGAAAVFILAHALLEEVTFRALVLIAFVNVWGGTTRGVIRSVVFSSLLFAAMHIINVAGGNPLPVVLLQSVGAFFLGILFSSLVLSGSIYPAVLLHGLVNMAGYLIFSASPEAAITPSAWLLQSTLMVPAAALALYILSSMRHRSIVPVAA